MLEGPLYLIGGNHVIKACQKLLEEERENEEFQSYSYRTPEQSKMIRNHHNQKTTIKKSAISGTDSLSG